MKRLREADPVLVDVQRALDVVPGMTPDTILTSGAQLDWPQYTGGQARAIAYAAIFEGLAADMPDAAAKLRAGHIKVRACHDHSCVGSVACVYTASMPVLVVENAANGNRGFCNFYEGDSRRRLNYGSYDADVHRSLCFVRDVIAPTLGAAIRRGGGLPLKPIMKRALHMGDELHSRNAAATLLSPGRSRRCCWSWRWTAPPRRFGRCSRRSPAATARAEQPGSGEAAGGADREESAGEAAPATGASRSVTRHRVRLSLAG